MKYIYGPVPSWRLGRSLGVDLISAEKVCTFDCTYCQLGRTVKKITKRQEFVPTKDVLAELKQVLPAIEADIITFSGTGEPTLASNLGEVAEDIRKITKLPLAILTNSSLIWKGNVQNDLKKLDIVVAKLDAPNEELFKKINRPVKGITFEKVLEGIKTFKKEYKGKLALQMMFVEHNKAYAKDLAELAREIKPDEVQLDTPLRPCPVKPLTPKEMSAIEKEFIGLNAISVYETIKPKVKIIDIKETLKRRPVL